MVGRKPIVCANKHGQDSKRYTVISKKGKSTSRCLNKWCKRSKDSRFWFNRDNDGKCGRVDENIPLALLPAYNRYVKDRRNASQKKSRKLKFK